MASYFSLTRFLDQKMFMPATFFAAINSPICLDYVKLEILFRGKILCCDLKLSLAFCTIRQEHNLHDGWL